MIDFVNNFVVFESVLVDIDRIIVLVVFGYVLVDIGIDFGYFGDGCVCLCGCWWCGIDVVNWWWCG